MANDGIEPDPYDVRSTTPHPGDPVVEGLPDVGGTEANAHRVAGGRVSSEAPVAGQVAVVQAVPVTEVHSTVEASSTTDPHHDRGSEAAGHVEDATPPETPIAEAPVEATHEAETPPHAEPAAEVAAPVEAAVPVEAHHDVEATVEPGHTGG